MPRLNAVSQLARTLERLRKERQAAAARLGEIDALFTKHDIAAAPANGIQRPPTHPAAAATAEVATPRQGPGGFDQTADEFILSLLQGKKLRAVEVNTAWAQAGRAGHTDLALRRLVEAGKLKRRKIQGKKGSRYTVA
jgi:hypothetical protein